MNASYNYNLGLLRNARKFGIFLALILVAYFLYISFLHFTEQVNSTSRLSLSTKFFVAVMIIPALLGFFKKFKRSLYVLVPNVFIFMLLLLVVSTDATDFLNREINDNYNTSNEATLALLMINIAYLLFALRRYFYKYKAFKYLMVLSILSLSWPIFQSFNALQLHQLIAINESRLLAANIAEFYSSASFFIIGLSVILFVQSSHTFLINNIFYDKRILFTTIIVVLMVAIYGHHHTIEFIQEVEGMSKLEFNNDQLYFIVHDLNLVHILFLYIALVLAMFVGYLFKGYNKLIDKKFQLSRVDSLTKVNNRSALNCLKDVKKAKFNEAFMFFDIDNFKSINAEYGHFIADKVLIELCQIISINLRPSEKFIRWGGDEFVLHITRYKDIKELELLCLRILDLIRSHKFISINQNISVSIGISEVCLGDTYRDRLKQAEKNMRKIKRDSKNSFLIK